MYGTSTGVAALTKKWTDDGEFTDEDYLECLQDIVTNPTLSEVETWLAQISDTLDVALDGKGFVTPITAPTKCVNMVTVIVEQYVADLVKYVNNTGRFVTERAQESGVEPMIQLSKDIATWVTTNAPALEAAGAARTDEEPGGQIVTKTNTPIFQRNAFGNKFRDWNNE